MNRVSPGPRDGGPVIKHGPSRRSYPSGEAHGRIIPLQPAKAEGVFGFAGRLAFDPPSSRAFNRLINMGRYSYSYYIQRILFQGTTKPPACHLIKLGESNGRGIPVGLNRLETDRAKNPFRVPSGVVCILRV